MHEKEMKNMVELSNYEKIRREIVKLHFHVVELAECIEFLLGRGKRPSQDPLCERDIDMAETSLVEILNSTPENLIELQNIIKVQKERLLNDLIKFIPPKV